MAGERTIEGWQLRLRPHGGSRYVSAAFLAFWLCGWAAGEAFATWMLVKGAIALLTGSPAGAGEPLRLMPAVAMGAFLIVWLTIWTIGGIAAGLELLRLLWGEDVITVVPDGLDVLWVRGPIRTRRHFDRDQIRRISLVGRDDRLSLETTRERLELSGLGTQPERVDGAAALRSELGLVETIPPAAIVLPKAWEEIITPEGERALVPDRSLRAKQARFIGIVALVLFAITFAIARKAAHRIDLAIPGAILAVFTLGAAAGALWLAHGRWEWRISPGRLTLRRRFGSGVRDVFEGRRLRLERSTDSEGDPWFELFASGDAEPPPAPAVLQWRPSTPRNSRSIARMMNDASSVRDLAQWLSRETGLPLDDRTTPEVREAELAALREKLASSGRLGAWAAKLLDRAEAQRKRAS